MSSLWSRIRGKSQAQDEASVSWRATMAAAARVPFYTRWRKELGRAQNASGGEDRGEALHRIPEVELDYFFQHFRQFRAKDAAAAKPREARSLWPGESRIAVVSPWFHVGGGARLLIKPEAGELQRYAPEVIAAPVDTLDALASAGWTQDESLFAIVALTGVGTPLLSANARLRLWRAFGVPVYVQLRGFQGELLARECEAHDGLHFDAADVFVQRRPGGELLLTSLDNQRHSVLRLATRLEASIETRVCDCGLASPRLMNLQAATGHGPTHARPSVAALAALATAVGESRAATAAPSPR